MQKEKSLVPQLRFSEFEGEWRKKKLENVCSFFSGGTPTSTKKEYYTGNIAFIGSGNIFDSSVEKYISEKAFKNSSAKIVGVGDILYALYGANSGDVAISKLYGAINQAILCIRTEEEKKFLYQVLTHKKESIVRTYLQGGQGNLSAKIVKKIKIRFPKKEEQQKIANFLSAIDKRIQTLVKKKTLLEQYKKGGMQKIFKQELRFKDDTSATLVASDGKAFPEWNKVQLSDIAERVKAKNKIDNQNVLTISAQLGLVSQLEYFNKSVSAKNLKGYYLLERNDFAYNKSYSKGYPMGAIKRLDKYDLGVVSTLYICFRFNEKVSHNFMEHYFDAGLQNRAIEKVAQEGARNHGLLNIGVNDFFEINLKIPSLVEQTKVANFLSAINENIELVTKKIEHTKTYKKGLLKQMFV
jgi:type I restriction enzyme S subunit